MSVVNLIAPRLCLDNISVLSSQIRFLSIAYPLIDRADQNSLVNKVRPVVYKLLNESFEISYLTFVHSLNIQLKFDHLFTDPAPFFIKYNDPDYIKIIKIKSLSNLEWEKAHTEIVLEELKDNCFDINHEISELSIEAITRLTVNNGLFDRICPLLLDILNDVKDKSIAFHLLSHICRSILMLIRMEDRSDIYAPHLKIILDSFEYIKDENSIIDLEILMTIVPIKIETCLDYLTKHSKTIHEEPDKRIMARVNLLSHLFSVDDSFGSLLLSFLNEMITVSKSKSIKHRCQFILTLFSSDINKLKQLGQIRPRKISREQLKIDSQLIYDDSTMIFSLEGSKEKSSDVSSINLSDPLTQNNDLSEDNDFLNLQIPNSRHSEGKGAGPQEAKTPIQESELGVFHGFDNSPKSSFQNSLLSLSAYLVRGSNQLDLVVEGQLKEDNNTEELFLSLSKNYYGLLFEDPLPEILLKKSEVIERRFSLTFEEFDSQPKEIRDIGFTLTLTSNEMDFSMEVPCHLHCYLVP